jgi:hypothetical protein
VTRSRLITVQEAIDTAAAALGQPDMENTWQSMNCSEVEALAEVFRLTGHDDTAQMVVGGHAWGDEPEDPHYPFIGSIVRRFSGEPRGEGIVTSAAPDDRRGARRVNVAWLDSRTAEVEHSDELEIVKNDPRTDWHAAIRGFVESITVVKLHLDQDVARGDG